MDFVLSQLEAAKVGVVNYRFNILYMIIKKMTQSNISLSSKGHLYVAEFG